MASIRFKKASSLLSAIRTITDHVVSYHEDISDVDINELLRDYHAGHAFVSEATLVRLCDEVTLGRMKTSDLVTGIRRIQDALTDTKAVIAGAKNEGGENGK
jgi:hypothetical protein